MQTNKKQNNTILIDSNLNSTLTTIKSNIQENSEVKIVVATKDNLVSMMKSDVFSRKKIMAIGDSPVFVQQSNDLGIANMDILSSGDIARSLSESNELSEVLNKYYAVKKLNKLSSFTGVSKSDLIKDIQRDGDLPNTN